jgi:L-ribulokinase
MSSLKEKRFRPDADARAVYDELYTLYRELHDTFGGVEGAKADLVSFMKRLLVIRERQAGE